MIAERRVSVKTTFAEMPALLCSPGPLNQAFSNIIANAVQASRPVQEPFHGDRPYRTSSFAPTSGCRR